MSWSLVRDGVRISQAQLTIERSQLQIALGKLERIQALQSASAVARKARRTQGMPPPVR